MYNSEELISLKTGIYFPLYMDVVTIPLVKSKYDTLTDCSP